MGRVVAVAAVVAVLSFAASAHASLVACPRGAGLVVRDAPRGAIVARLSRRTEFGSPLVLSVAARRGRWLGVLTPSLANGRLGWVDGRSVRLSSVHVRIEVSLSSRQLVLLRAGRVVARAPVAVGAPASPTPTGTFAVTDKLSGDEYGGVYGCCILALSGHQPHPPRGWTGSDTRLAVHGGGGIGGAVSAGCLHASTWLLRLLLAEVPLGTRVTIRR